MASLLVVLIILGCVAHQYLKSTLVKSFATTIITICASMVAFGYFEILANVIINRSQEGSYLFLVPWAQSICFVLLFVLAFAILQTIVAKLTLHPIGLGVLAERIGRTVCGFFLGLILAGLLLTALAMAPLSNKYPYQRFDATSPDVEKPNKILFNADGFATGWFSIVSNGSFSGKRSFAALHPDFLSQTFLNRHKVADGVSIAAGPEAIKVPGKKAVWPAPQDLKDAEDPNEPIKPKNGHNLTVVRLGIKKNAIKKAGTFTTSQLRLVCKRKSGAKKPLVGRGKNVYPIGYLKTVNQLQIKQLNDKIKIKHTDFDGQVLWIDFVFDVPNGFLPTLVEFKQNNIALVPPPVTAEQAPPAATFTESVESKKDTAQPPASG